MASRSRTSRSRPKTAATSVGYSYHCDELLCAVSESRGISPIVGLAFVNLSTCEAVLCQFVDTQSYARSCHKIKVFGPTEIISSSSATDSKMLSTIKENFDFDREAIAMTQIDRKYWCERSGHDYIHQLTPSDDFESLKLVLTSNSFAVCSLAAAIKYIDLGLGQTFAPQTLRMKFETSEGTMFIDPSTIANLEIIQNLQEARSKECLFGLLRQTLTSMGTRLLKTAILQPSTEPVKISRRHEAVEELSSHEERFLSLRDALNGFVDTDKTLAAMSVIPRQVGFQYMEQAVNNVLMLKSFVDAIKPIWQALTGVRSAELEKIRELCNPQNYVEVQALIDYTINPDVAYSQKAIDLRAHRVFAIKAGTNGFLDVARKSYLEFVQDMNDLAEELQEQQKLPLELKFDATRQYYLQVPTTAVKDHRSFANTFVNIFRNTRKKCFELQTMEVVKLNQKIKDAHNEVIAMSDRSIQELILAVRTRIYPLFKISEGIALLDMLLGFAQVATSSAPDEPYIRPQFTGSTFALKAARHPVSEKIIQQNRTSNTTYVSNDIYATPQRRFQIITGCNMSGKSTYIRLVATISIMAQIGSFVPAEHASLPIIHQVFARVATDDSIEASVSSFAAEMREMAFILRNIEPPSQNHAANASVSLTNKSVSIPQPPLRSIIMVDELGRGTSTTDGLAIALAISEALLQSRSCYIWFVTHYRDLAHILSERPGVVNLHMSVSVEPDFSRMQMRYKIAEGSETQRFYGLALAQVVHLPERVMETAVQVARALNERNNAKREAGGEKAVLVARRRKLVLELKDALEQLRESQLNKRDMRKHLKSLQEDFIQNMSKVDASQQADDRRSTTTTKDDLRTSPPILEEALDQTSPEKAVARTPSPNQADVRTDRLVQGASLSGREEKSSRRGTGYDDAIVIEDDGLSESETSSEW